MEAVNEVRLQFETFHANQRRIYESGARFRVAACGRRFGKTTVGERALIKMAVHGKHVWWTSPTADMAAKVWRALKWRLWPMDCEIRESERIIWLPTGGMIEVKSTHEYHNLRGVGLDFVVLDEAAFMHMDVWPQVIRPMLLERKGGALFLSTPFGRNHFFDLYNLGLDPQEPEWEAFHFTSYDNPLIDPVELNNIQRNTPERIWQEEYLAEFIDGSGQVFRNVKGIISAPLDVQPVPGHRYVAGLDWARDVDYTVILVIDADTKQMVDIDRFNQVSWNLQRDRVKAMQAKWNLNEILAESNSIGSVNIEALQAEGLPVRPFQTTAQSKGPLIDALAAATENGRVAIQNHEALVGELLAYRIERLPGGGYRYGAPAGQHDDTVIALALAWHGVAHEPARIVGTRDW